MSGVSSLVRPSTADLSPVASGSSGVTQTPLLVGGEIWLNNSIAFTADAESSVILSLPTISSWLSSHSIPLSELRPYLSGWPSQGNPYDYAQTTVAFPTNGTLYGVYAYILPNGTVIAAWVSQGSTRSVEKIFTYPSQSNTLSDTGFTVKDHSVVGHQAEDSNSGGSSSMDGAVMNTAVFSDLTNPSGCTSQNYCWYWANWLGTSNYNYNTSAPPSDAFFFQVILQYWGGTESEPTNCGSYSYTGNCVFFQYVLDDGSLMTTTPGVGGWGADSVTYEWPSPTENCSPKGGVTGAEDWWVVLEITNVNTNTVVSSGECFPTNPYVQFLEERSLANDHLPQEPEFGYHEFSAALLNPSGNEIPLNSGSNTWAFNMYNGTSSVYKTELVSTTTLDNGASTSTWTDTWLSSTYP